jgi:hypothetical protein
VFVVTQLPDCDAGSTPVFVGNLSQYLTVWKSQPTIEVQSVGFCYNYFAELQAGGTWVCPGAGRLLRIK